MSAFYLLALLGIWLLVGWGIYRLWRRWRPPHLAQKVLHIGFGVLLFSIWFGGAFWEVAGKKMYWDAKVREMCAEDGGIKVYETVELPAEMFNRWGNVQLPSESQAKQHDVYFYKRESKFLRTEDPKISRTRYVIIRHSDGKVLGESVHYSRSGGDLPGPWHPSSYICPTISKGHVGIEKQLFKKRGGSE